MGPILASLLKLQGIEHDLAHVRRRLRSKERAVQVVQGEVAELGTQQKALHEQMLSKQSETDRLELDRAAREEDITQLRTALNRAKTNREYSAILTQINTLKADNSKLEDDILKTMGGVDTVKTEAERIGVQIEVDQKRLDEVSQSSSAEVDRLTTLMGELQSRREEAAKVVAPEALRVFERLARARDGAAMAPIDVISSKRGEYSCGGCYMALSTEHYNALLSRDEIRHCDSCGRILYVAPDAVPQK